MTYRSNDAPGYRWNRSLVPWTRVGTLPVGLAGEDVVAAVQAHPAPNYLVVSGDRVVGVLRTADLVRLLNA